MFAPALAALFLLAGCASGGSYRMGMPAQVSLRDYRSGLTMEIRNESHTPASSQYNKPAAGRATKIVKDDLMEALLRRLDEEGFSQFARSGNLPASAVAGALYGIGVEFGGASRTLLRTPGGDAKVAAALVKMTQTFREFYDGVFQAQTVDQEGAKLFEEEQKKLEKLQGKKGGGTP